MNIKLLIIEDLSRAGAFILMYFIFFLIAKYFKDLFTSYKINEQLAKEDNLAIALAMSGYYLASSAIFTGTLLGPSQGLLNDLILVGGYSFLGLCLLNASRWFNDKFILSKFCDTEQLVREKNVGVGAVHFGVYVATGIIAAGALSGQGGGIISSLVFFVLGQLSLFIFAYIYEKSSKYNIHEELLNKNTASGVAFAGNIIALSIIVMNAASGDFINWQNDLISFGLANLLAFIFLPIIRLLMDRLVIRGYSLGQEIKQDKNIGAGFLEAVIAISFAIVLTRLI